MGKRLCTADEWEKACKGRENFIYSYGDALDEDICPYSADYILGSNENCVSSYGVYGMSAGPREWTATKAASGGTRFVIKGGTKIGHPVRAYRCAYYSEAPGTISDNQLSFRCCMDAPQ